MFAAAAAKVFGCHYLFGVEAQQSALRGHAACWDGGGYDGAEFGQVEHMFEWFDDPGTTRALCRLARLDIFQYSPRCSPFSKRSGKAWRQRKRQDEVRRAFYEMDRGLEYVRRARPLTIIIENVMELTTWGAGEAWAAFGRLLESLGAYEWEIYWGKSPRVSRTRLIVIGAWRGE